MTLLPIFIACAFTLVALWFMIAPFLGGNDAHVRLEHLDEQVQEIEALTTRRSVLLAALRELEFDREINKLSEEDFETFRRRYEAEAVRIVRRLHEIHGGDDWQARVDQELEERLGRPSSLSAKPPEPAEVAPEQVEAEQVEAAKVEAGEVEAGDQEPAEEVELAPEEPEPDEAVHTPSAETCVGCGEALKSDDKFCSQCGTAVIAVVATVAAVPSATDASA